MKRIGAESRHRVDLTLNGREAGGWAEPRMLLSDFLRHELGATGTHVGCEHGVCGACTVRLDGAPVRACLTLAVQAEGRRVDTVEGLAPEGELNELQKAFPPPSCSPVRLLHAWHFDVPRRLSGNKTRAGRRGDPRAAQRPSLPLHGLFRDCGCCARGGRRRGGARMTDLGRVLIAAAERNLHALAVVDGERRFDYGAWLDTVSRVAGGIGTLGLRPGDRLAVIMQNRWEMAALHWACQLAGVVVVPLNWRSNAGELDYFLTDSGAAALAFDESAAAAVADSAGAARLRRIGVGATSEGTAPFADLLAAPAEATPRAGEDDLSLMLYTSGTTGRGKGVPRTHRAERAAALAHIAQNCYRTGERTLGVMPLYHTMGVRSLLAMAPVGGAFVCQPRFDADGALRLIEAERITALYLVPTLYYDLLGSPGFARADISSVRKLGFAGAPMAEGLLRRVEDAFRPELFVNHYGSSEIYTFTIDRDAAAKPGSAGKAGINQRIRVVEIGAGDPDRTVPAGTEGEVIASLESDEAFAGYWQRPDADARALKQGWYFTGDVGYCDADGDLFVTGRVDDMIITGGENVLPAEIESVLSVHPAVAEAAVAGLADERWGQKVAAFVVRGGPLDVAGLDAHCRASALADFKRPRTYVFVRAIPKSPVGKVLRRLLIAGAYEEDDDAAGAEAGGGRGA